MRTLVLVLIVGLLALAAVPAKADVFTYAFTSDHCTGGCTIPGAANMGTITVSDISTGVVGVNVVLADGFGFVMSGAGGDPPPPNPTFFFRLLGDPTIAYSGLTAGWSIPNVIPTDQQAAGTYAGDGLIGQFEYALSCNPPGVAGGGCGNGGSAPNYLPLDFTVTATGLSAASFNDSGNASGSQFAADVISSNGKTGLIDATLVSDGSVDGGGGEVPEPTSIILLGTILTGIAAIWRKKAQKSA